MKSSFKNSFLVFLWGASLTGVSALSGYGIYTSVGSVSFDIATMLTPWGFFKNFLLISDSSLAPYYFYPTQGRVSLFSEPFLVVGIILVFFFSLRLLKAMREKNG